MTVALLVLSLILLAWSVASAIRASRAAVTPTPEWHEVPVREHTSTLDRLRSRGWSPETLRAQAVILRGLGHIDVAALYEDEANAQEVVRRLYNERLAQQRPIVRAVVRLSA